MLASPNDKPSSLQETDYGARAATYVDTFMAVMARVQLGVILSDADTREIVAFLESLTGELPASFATVPVLPSGAPVSPK